MTHSRKQHRDHGDRRARFEEQPSRSSWSSATSAMLVVCVLLAGVFAYLVTSAPGAQSEPDAGVAVATAGQDVQLPLATFSDGAARFYRYTTAGGREIRFFVMRSSDGVVRAAFDACDTCFRDRRGYRQQGDVMVCNKCSRSFRSVDINVLQGGCNPAPLERAVVGDQVVLRAAALEAGEGYF